MQIKEVRIKTLKTEGSKVWQIFSELPGSQREKGHIAWCCWCEKSYYSVSREAECFLYFNLKTVSLKIPCMELCFSLCGPLSTGGK